MSRTMHNVIAVARFRSQPPCSGTLTAWSTQ